MQSFNTTGIFNTFFGRKTYGFQTPAVDWLHKLKLVALKHKQLRLPIGKHIFFCPPFHFDAKQHSFCNDAIDSLELTTSECCHIYYPKYFLGFVGAWRKTPTARRYKQVWKERGREGQLFAARITDAAFSARQIIIQRCYPSFNFSPFTRMQTGLAWRKCWSIQNLFGNDRML